MNYITLINESNNNYVMVWLENNVINFWMQFVICLLQAVVQIVMENRLPSVLLGYQSICEEMKKIDMIYKDILT